MDLIIYPSLYITDNNSIKPVSAAHAFNVKIITKAGYFKLVNASCIIVFFNVKLLWLIASSKRDASGRVVTRIERQRKQQRVHKSLKADYITNAVWI